MAPAQPLPPEALYTRCTLDHLAFATTADLHDGVRFVGQQRPIAAIELGVTMNRPGYNIFALGPSGTGKHTVVNHFVQERAAAEPTPDDWCYVNNFEHPGEPRALRLPTGMGRQLKHDMERLVEDLRTGLSSAFESEEYTTRRRVLEGEFQERQEDSFSALQEQARQHDLTMVRTPAGLVFAALRDGKVVSPEDFQKLPEADQKRIEEEIEGLQGQLQRVLLQVPRWQREYRSRLRELNISVSELVVNDQIDDLLAKYKALPGVVTYLEAVQRSVADHLDDFLQAGEQKDEEGPSHGPPLPDALRASPALRPYEVNVLVDSSGGHGAPVIYESNPSYLNLVGRVEQMAVFGALLTDFTLIRAGDLHRANGGYLIMDALKVLTSPYAWEGLKRALQFGQVRIESPVQMLSLTSTVSLEPEPIPLDIKVILLGDRQLYYMLAQADPDFNELFKVAADFDDRFVRDEETTHEYAMLIASVVRDEQLLPFDKSAVCRVIERGARLAGDAERVTAHVRDIVDLLRESDHWARLDGAQVVTAAHVQRAIDGQIYRSDRVREQVQEEMLRKTIFIDTQGARPGQINGLSVMSLGTFSFGRPSRITATVHAGKGEVLDIEREVEMSGPIHSKGVLILASFLRSRYAQERPLSLGASLVFEQSYSGVEGDSASSAELYTLLSAIAGVPIRQSLAVTGSVNQKGEVQPIGGANEKIQGLFDLCNARGLTGDQGVLIPESNVKHLMLRHDVVAAVAAGRFAVYPVRTIDEGIELLTGVPAGEPDAAGHYPEGTINRMVADRLAEMAERSRALAEEAMARLAGAGGAAEGGDGGTERGRNEPSARQTDAAGGSVPA